MPALMRRAGETKDGDGVCWLDRVTANHRMCRPLGGTGEAQGWDNVARIMYLSSRLGRRTVRSRVHDLHGLRLVDLRVSWRVLGSSSGSSQRLGGSG